MRVTMEISMSYGAVKIEFTKEAILGAIIDKIEAPNDNGKTEFIVNSSSIELDEVFNDSFLITISSLPIEAQKSIIIAKLKDDPSFGTTKCYTLWTLKNKDYLLK